MQHQQSFVLTRDLQFIDLNFVAKEGDIVVHTPPETLVVYRNGDIQVQMGITQAAVNGLMVSGAFKRIRHEQKAAKPVVKDPEPAVELQVEEDGSEEASVPEQETVQVEEEAPLLEEPIATMPEDPVATTPEAPGEEEEPEVAQGDVQKPEGPKKIRKSKKQQ